MGLIVILIWTLPSELPRDRTQGEALIGGPFTLTNQHGQAVSDQEFRGKIMLVFFGFTHCPDICPAAAANITAALGMIGEKADKVAPVFISVDPARDTPEVLKEFFVGFDPRFIALTGSEEDIKSAADAYKAFYMVMEDSQSSNQDHYMVNHSGFIYLMDENGRYVRHFNHNATPEEIATSLRAVLR